MQVEVRERSRDVKCFTAWSFTHNNSHIKLCLHRGLSLPASRPGVSSPPTAGPGWFLCVLPRGRMNVNVDVKSHNLAVPTLRRGKLGRVGW